MLRWALLLQEFDIEIKDRAGAENHVADHLSRLPDETRGVDKAEFIFDSFPDEILCSIALKEPWYAHIVNYLMTKLTPPSMSSHQVQKLQAESRYYVWDEPFLWRLCGDQIIRRCIPQEEQPQIISACHTLSCGGHFSSKRTARKILESGFYWPVRNALI